MMRALLLRIGLSVLVVGLARLGAWTLVAAVTSVAFVLVRARHNDERHRRPRHLAAMAVTAVDDPPLEPGVRRLVLDAVVAPSGSLARASEHLRSENRGLGRWALGTERLELAEHASEGRPWLHPQRAPRSGLALGFWAATSVCLAAATAVTGNAWVAVLFVGSCTALVTVLTDARRDHEWTPLMLAALAAAPFTHGNDRGNLDWRDGWSRPVVDRAERIVRSWPLDDPTRQDALSWLDHRRDDMSIGPADSRWRAVGMSSAGLLAGIATWMVPL